MKHFVQLTLVFFLLLTALPVNSFATSVEELERRLDLVTEELQKLKNESAVEDVEYTSRFGMGPAASKVYQLNKGLSIGGYGEG